jgi:hypothetical protein
MEEMMRMKVDGIITDYPNLILEASTSCKQGRHFFQGQCLKIPKNASPSNDIPGWNCDPGFVQKRMKCRKIILPKNSELTTDGKSWQCKKGFKRYRGSCI